MIHNSPVSCVFEKKKTLEPFGAFSWYTGTENWQVVLTKWFFAIYGKNNLILCSYFLLR
jgi:hypothetical protein